ncbi:MAG: tetratricopeptide repeat protein [Candidatus Acidiferrales bacterium]
MTLPKPPFTVFLHLYSKQFAPVAASIAYLQKGKRNELNSNQPSTPSHKNKRLSALALVSAALILLVAFVPGLTRLHAQPQVPGGETGVSVESSQQLFATMCALDAAGFDSDESTLAEMPSRLKLREDLLRLQGPSVDALRQFYRDHELADPGETLSRFITFAVVVGPPPRFQFEVDRDILPPDALAIEGFQEVLANFYREAHLDRSWVEVQPEYDRAVQRDESPVRHIVLTANGYLREIYKPKFGHSFTVYVEPLVGKRTNFRNTGDHYSIVVGTGSEFPYDDVQHAYLHFMLDPLPLKFRKEVTAKTPLLNIGAKSPRLPAEYRSDFLAYADECFIKAVELRLQRLKDDKLEAALAEDDQNGFTMVRPLVAQLLKFEKAEPSMSLYFPDLINGIDVPAEQKRLANFVFKSDAELAGGTKAKPALADPGTELDRWLADGDRQVAVQNATAATATFEKILEKYPGDPRAYYGLAVASLLNQDIDRAQQIFQNIVESSSGSTAPAGGQKINPPDPNVLAWSHVYLGRLHDVADERDLAVVEYRAALAVPGAPEAALVAAQRGVDRPYSPAANAAGNKPDASQKN